MSLNHDIDFNRIISTQNTTEDLQQLERKSQKHICHLLVDIELLWQEIQQQSSSKTIKPSNTSKLNTMQSKKKIQKKEIYQKYKGKDDEGIKNSMSDRVVKNNIVSSIHFASYMKPIGQVSSRIMEQLQKEHESSEIERLKQLQKVQHLKQKVSKHYLYIKSRYSEYEQVRKAKQALEESYLKQKETHEIVDLTFTPKTNKNIHIMAPFQERLKDSAIKKQKNQAQIIKEAMKNETFRPKINILSQAKIKLHQPPNNKNSHKFSKEQSESN